MPFIKLFFVFFICATATSVASPPDYGEGKATQDKIQYCNMMVNSYGFLSQRINEDYYGLGVKRPTSENWAVRIKKPSFFSDKLYIVFEQTTKEKYEDYEHVLHCMWDKKRNGFEFVIKNHSFRAAPFCYRRMSDVRTDDMFFFNPTTCP
jgi:hypothetical protein